MNSNHRSFILWGIIALLMIGIFSFFQGTTKKYLIRKLNYSDFIHQLNIDQIKEVTIQGSNISGVTTNNQHFFTYMPKDQNLISRLEEKKVIIKVEPETTGTNPIFSLLFSSLPIIALMVIWIFFMRQIQGGSRGAMGFGKSKAKLLNENQVKITFKNVAGVDEAKADLEEIVEFLKNPKKFQRLGGRIPRGVLLIGPPGTGKTLLAKAIAGEANVPFFTISGSDFVEMFVGIGASRVRDMFAQAKKNSPCIIFIDEIDAVGRHRGAGLGGGNDEREQTLNQLLVEMDGFESYENIIIIAATNRPDVLDPALLRPGRFDRQVIVPNPDIKGREKIIKVHINSVPIAPNVNIRIIARGTPGFSGADLMNLVNEAALMAAKRDKKLVTMKEFEDAKDKVLMGSERKSSAMTQEEKELTAYHEAGHAIVALNVPAADPIHKATIIPRGHALGMVMQLPEGDKYSMNYTWMISKLKIMMGGRAAETIKFGKDNITSGAASDIEQATKLARAMVTRWGLSDKLGHVSYGDNQNEIFLGHSLARQNNISEETSRIIDIEIRSIINKAYKDADYIIRNKNKEWTAIAKGLLEYETLTGDEMKKLIIEGKIIRTGNNNIKRTSGVPKTGVTPSNIT